MKKILCARNHRMVPIVADLYICECSSYGRLTDMKGAVEDARRMVESAGGIAVLRDRIEREEEERKAEAKNRKAANDQALRGAIRSA